VFDSDVGKISAQRAWHMHRIPRDYATVAKAREHVTDGERLATIGTMLLNMHEQLQPAHSLLDCYPEMFL